MHPRPAFALPDLVASVAGLAVLLSVSAAVLAEDEVTEQRLQNSTQLRGIHQGLVVYANSNKEKFPGLDSRGDTLENGPETTGNSGDGETTEARFWILVEHDFVTPEYIQSPREESWERCWDPGFAETAPIVYENYSYAMLDIAQDASNRRAEWTQSLNTLAVVLSDRNCSDLNEQEPFSIWNDEEWHGSVLWNDNHVGYEETQVLETRYGTGKANLNEDGEPTDDLFTLETSTGDEALMTYSRDEDGSERAVPRYVDEEEDE